MPGPLQLGDVQVDLRRGLVSRGRQVDSLSTRQAALLQYLVERPGEVVGRDDLLRDVWGYGPEVLSRAVDTAVRRLRRLIEADPAAPRYVVTVHGEGYRFEPPEAAGEVASPSLPREGWRRFAGWRVSLGRLRLVRGDQEVQLTAREGDLLAFLLANPRRLLERDELRRRVWGYRQSSRVVDNAVRRLRLKLEADPGAPRHLVTLRGRGVVFDPDPDADVVPRGRVALVETWIEGAPARWRSDPEGMADVVSRHDRVLRHRAATAGAYEVRGDDDGLRLAFETATAAVQWCLAARRDLAGLGLPVAMGVAVGRPRLAVDPASGRTGYRGEVLYEVRGLARAAHGGQLLASAMAWELAAVPGATATEMGPFVVAGVDVPVEIVQIDDGEPRRFPPLTARSARRGWVPSAGSALVGRADVVARVRRLVAEVRWVTLVGPGGVGKTRLALEVATDLLGAGACPGGVWFVDLAGCADRRGVEFAVARVVGLDAGDLATALGLRGRCVLVLDNAEHVRHALRDGICAWLAGTRDLRVLVTTRAALGTPDEHLVPVAPLDPAAAASLFLTRARQADPALVADAGVVERIVRDLDGIPLALELTAARARHLPLAAIQAHLAAAPGTALGAAVSSSWRLLSQAHRDAWVRLGVFRGGFTLEAAAAVGAGSEVVFGLLDHSLVHRRGDRYDLYRAAAAWAWDHPSPAAEEAHGRWCAALGEAEALEAMFAPGGLTVRQNLRAELDNLVVAVERAVRRGDAAVGVGAALAALAVLEATGPFDVAEGLARAVLTVELSEAQAAVLGLALGRVLWFASRPAEAEAALAPAARHPATTGAAGMVLGLVRHRLGHRDRARYHLQGAHVELASTGHDRLAATCLGNLAIVEQEAGNLDLAEDLYDRALAVHRRMGNRWDEGIVLHDTAYVPFMRGHRDQAARILVEALIALRESDNRRVVATALANLCVVRASQGRVEDALQLRAEARLELEEIGNPTSRALADIHLGRVLLPVEPELARDLIRAAGDEARALGLAGPAAMAADLLAAAG